MSEPDLTSDNLDDSTVAEDIEGISTELQSVYGELESISNHLHSVCQEQSTVDLGAEYNVDTELGTVANSESGEPDSDDLYVEASNDLYVEASDLEPSLRRALDNLPSLNLTESTSADSSPTKTLAESSTRSNRVKNLVQIFDPITYSTKVISKSQGSLTESSDLSKNPPTALRSKYTVINVPNLDINRVERNIKKQKAKDKSSASNSKAKSKVTQPTMALANQNAIYNHHRLLIQTQIDNLDPIIKLSSHSQEQLVDLEDKLFLVREYRKTQDNHTRQLNNSINNPSTSPETLTGLLALSTHYNVLGSKLSLLQSKIETIINKWKKEDDILDQKRVSIPEFHGIFVDYKTFRESFTNLTRGLSKGNQKIRLNEVLKGEARSRVEDLLKGETGIDKILENLDNYYNDPKQITDVTIKELFNLARPSFHLKILANHFTNFKNKAHNVLTLAHDPEELLVAYYLTQIPGKFRTLIERELDKKQTKYKFEDIGPIVDLIVRRESHEDENDTSHTSYNVNANDVSAVPVVVKSKNKPNNQQPTNTNTTSTTTNQQNNPSQGQQQPNSGGGQNRGGYNRGRCRGRGGGRGGYSYQRPLDPCKICQSTDHLYYRCDKFSAGQEMRDELKKLKLCLNCLKPEIRHGNECDWDRECYKCKNGKHNFITCSGAGDSHPGSQFAKPKSS